MVVVIFERPHVFYQTADDDCGIPEAAIAASVDGGGMIILSQEGREIIVNRASAKELAKLISKLAIAP